jgi:hypothetical protein
MARWDAVTRRGTLVPSVLVVGSSPEFIRRCRGVTPEGMLVGGASLGDYAKQAARLRPYVIVVTEDVRAFDGARLDDLAKAVGAKVACFANENVPDVQLSRTLARAIADVGPRRET